MLALLVGAAGADAVVPAGVPDPVKTTIGFAADAPRFVPADSKATTTLVAKVRDASGTPVAGREVRLVRVGESASRRRGSHPAGFVNQVERTDGSGKAWFRVFDDSPGQHRFRLTDVATGTTLGPAFGFEVEFTRKVIVLVMGFRSSLRKRMCYWGAPLVAPPADCEDFEGLVTVNTGTVYGKLVSDLGYRVDSGPGDSGATILDMSWDATPCGSPSRSCVASIANQDGDVTWTPPAYDLGEDWWEVPNSVDRQRKVDAWAGRLVNTLAAYDAALADPTVGRGYHATFYLVGHSMGGELVVRALRKILDHAYFAPKGAEATRRGLIGRVIAVDGALNWGTAPGGLLPAVRELVPFRCRSPVRTARGTSGDTREGENVTAVEDASRLLGIPTLLVTNDDDRIVRPDIALLERPDKPVSGYGVRRFHGFGAAAPVGDPNCGHSTLLRSQPEGLFKTVGGKDVDVAFPLGDIFAKWVGRAAYGG